MAANPFAARTDGDWSIAMPNDLAGLKEGLNGLGAWLERHQIDTETENSARLAAHQFLGTGQRGRTRTHACAGRRAADRLRAHVGRPQSLNRDAAASLIRTERCPRGIAPIRNYQISFFAELF